MARPKRIQKSRDELLAGLKKSQEWRDAMLFVKTKFYPALLDIDSSIDDTKIFLSSINTILMEKFLGEMKKLKFGYLNMKESLDKKDEKYESYCQLLDLFEDKSIFDSKTLIEGMRNELDTFIIDEMKQRKLSTLKTKFLDEL